MSGEENPALGAELQDDLGVELEPPLDAAVELDAEIAPGRVAAVVVAHLPERAGAVRVDHVRRRLREDDPRLEIELPPRTEDHGGVHVRCPADAAVGREQLRPGGGSREQVRVLREGRGARGLPGEDVVEEHEADAEIRVHHEAARGAVVRVRVAGRVARAERGGDVGIALFFVRLVGEAEAESGRERAHLFVLACARLGLGAVDAGRPPGAGGLGLAEHPRARAGRLRREATARVDEPDVELLAEGRQRVSRVPCAGLVARGEDGGELVFFVSPDRPAEPLVGVVAALELRVLIAVDEVAGDEDGELRGATEGPGGEEHALGRVAAAVVAEERGVIAVVGDHAHPDVVRLLPDADETDLRPEVGVEPARVEVDRVGHAHRVARGVDVARGVPEEAARDVDLGDDLEHVEELKPRRETEPVLDHAPLRERGLPRVERGREERHVALEHGAELVFPVDLEADRVALRLRGLDPAGLEVEARKKRARLVGRGGARHGQREERGDGEERAHAGGGAQHNEARARAGRSHFSFVSRRSR